MRWAPGTWGTDRLKRGLSREDPGWSSGAGGVRLRRPSRRSRRAPAKPTAPSGSSAAAPGTSCTTTTSTESGRRASNGDATWTAVSSGRSAGARRPRCAREAGVGMVGALSRLGAPMPRPPSPPLQVPGFWRALLRAFLFLCFFFFFREIPKISLSTGFSDSGRQRGEWRVVWEDSVRVVS